MVERAEKSPLDSTLVKVSGDLVKREVFYTWLRKKESSFGRLVILAGGGSAITERLNEEHIAFRFTPYGREIDSQRGRKIAEEVLYFQKKIVEKKLRDEGIKADVVVPVFALESGPLHLNGDGAALALQVNFGKIFVVTVNGNDKSELETHERVEVVYL